MMKIRIKFRKYGVMRFIGHLDMMRYFQKAIRRAEIDICYSEGFSPHQIMSFAAPLGVGITSDGEYLDIEVNSASSSKEAIAALNSVMVEGVEITGYVRLPEHAKTAMSIVAAADYDLFYKEGYEAPASAEELRAGIVHFFQEREEVLIKKQTKKSEKTMDLKTIVYDFEVAERGGSPWFYLKVSTGSADNLKPELVIASLYEFMGIPYEEEAIQIHRRDVYAKNPEGDGFLPLLALGEELV